VNPWDGYVLTYYYPMLVTTCAFTPFDDLNPIKIKGDGFTFGATRG